MLGPAIALLIWGDATVFATGDLKTARTHRIEVAGSASGIEAQMPRTGPYARGVRSDAELDFSAARQFYAQAAEEFRRRGQDLWAEKASRQLTTSTTLERAPMVFRQVAPISSVVSTAQWRLPFALAYHEKYLSTRAFLGKSTPELAARARAIYRQILDAEPDNVSARLDLASLDADSGEIADAEAEFVRVGEARREEDVHAIELARYFAARGDAERAFRALDRARRRLPGELRDLALMNGFDRLRRDPRWLSVVGRTATPDRVRPIQLPRF